MTMSRFTSVRFGPCEIDLAQRELRLHGQVKQVRKRAFDLIVYLLERNDEVVSKEELCRVLWGEDPASINMLAKTVMRARQAIGDDAVNPEWIKTVRGVGFRLAGERTMRSDGADRSATHDVRALPAGASALRLALLPIDNRTGYSDLAWVELGLAALIVEALQGDPHLSILPLENVTRALAELPSGDDVAARAQALQEALGVRCVIHAAMYGVHGALRLQYRSHSTAQPGLEGDLIGGDAVQLGELLVQRLTQGLLPKRDHTVRFGSSNVLFNQLFARAMQAAMRRQSRDAITFVRAALLLEPHSVPGRLLLLNAMVRCGDAAVWADGDELIAEARANSDERLEGMVHEALMPMTQLGDLELARHHARLALSVAANYGDEDWALRVRSHAGVEASTRNAAEAMTHFEWIRQAHKRVGSRLSWTVATINLAVMHVATCELAAAQALFEEILPLARHHRWKWLEAVALSNLSAIHAELGRMSTAREHLRMADALGVSVQDDVCICILVGNAIAFHAQAGHPLDIGRLLHRWPQLRTSADGMLRASFRMAQSTRAAMRGWTGPARIWMREAIAVAVEMNYAPTLDTWLAKLLLFELQAGAFANARAVCKQIEALRTFADCADLRVWVKYAEAAELHAQGGALPALQVLAAAVKVSRPGLADAYARLAAAWLCLEQDKLAHAVHLIQPVAPWLEEHPFGLTIAARLHCEQGDMGRAVERQQRAVSLWTGRPGATPLLSLLATYQAAGDAAACSTATAVRLTALPKLLTLL